MSTVCTIDNNSNNDIQMKEMESEAVILKEIQNKMPKSLESFAPLTPEEQKAVDSKSVFVGNVDFSSTIEEIEGHFKGCGVIIRTTIPKDKFTKKQKNFAYIEFDSVASVENPLVMDGSIFRERKIVVTLKRTNKPGMGYMSRGSSSRGQFGRGRGANCGGYGRQETVVVKYVYVNGPAPSRAARGGRGRRFTPY